MCSVPEPVIEEGRLPPYSRMGGGRLWNDRSLYVMFLLPDDIALVPIYNWVLDDLCEDIRYLKHTTKSYVQQNTEPSRDAW